MRNGCVDTKNALDGDKETKEKGKKEERKETQKKTK